MKTGMLLEDMFLFVKEVKALSPIIDLNQLLELKKSLVCHFLPMRLGLHSGEDNWYAFLHQKIENYWQKQKK